jgi:hypothetical protein
VGGEVLGQQLGVLVLELSDDVLVEQEGDDLEVGGGEVAVEGRLL